jgi:NAD(P)H-flavin reductase
MFRILRRQALSDSTFLWELQAEEIARAARSGQFVIVRLRDGGERIPLTIADFDPIRGSVTVVVQVAGRTTREMSERYGEGDSIQDLVGPLGVAGEVAKFGRVVLVGGGLGVAPLFPQVRALREAGNHVTAILGFRSADRLFWVDRFAEFCHETVVCTEDGSRGRKGLVTAALAEIVDGASPPDRVIAIGPVLMMRACAEVTRARAIATVASLNSIMIDGTGMCGSCRVTVGGEVRFACVDGPEFDAHAVDFAGMQRRVSVPKSGAPATTTTTSAGSRRPSSRRGSATTRGSASCPPPRRRWRSATRRSARATSRRSRSATSSATR